MKKLKDMLHNSMDIRQIGIITVLIANLFACRFVIPISISPTASPTDLISLSDQISENNIDKVHELARFGNGVVTKIAYSSTGKSIFLSTSLGVDILDAQELSVRRHIETHEWVTEFAISPDGKTIAIPTSTHAIGLWEAQSGKLLFTLPCTGLWIWGLAFSPDGKMLVASTANQFLTLWNLSDQKTIASKKLERPTSVTFSPDARYLAIATENGPKLVNVPDLSPGPELKGQEEILTRIAFSPDGKLLATGSTNGSVNIYQMEDQGVKFSIFGHNQSIQSLFFTVDGSQIVSASSNGIVKLSDPEDGHVIKTFDTYRYFSNITSAAMAPDSSELLVVSAKGEALKIDQKRNHEEIYHLDAFFNSLNSTAFSSNGHLLVAGSTDGWVHVIDLVAQHWKISIPFVNLGEVKKVIFLPDTDKFIAGFQDGSILQSDISGQTGWRDRLSPEIQQFTLSPDGKKLAVSTSSNQIRIYQAEDGTKLSELDGQAMDFSPDGKTIAIVTNQGNLEIWDAEKLNLLRSLAKGYAHTKLLRFSPDGNLIGLMTQTRDQMDYGVVYNISDGSSNSSGYVSAGITDLDFTSDSRIVANSTNSSPEVQFWRPSDAYSMGYISGHTWIIMDIAINQTGTLFATAGTDGTVRLWGVQ